MNDHDRRSEQPVPKSAPPAQSCQSIDWYHEGESRSVEVDGVQIIVRFIGRKGRRGRIAIEAPAGAVFRALDPGGVTDRLT